MSNYPPGVTDADFMEQEPPEWFEDYMALYECIRPSMGVDSPEKAIEDMQQTIDALKEELKIYKEDHSDKCFRRGHGQD